MLLPERGKLLRMGFLPRRVLRCSLVQSALVLLAERGKLPGMRILRRGEPGVPLLELGRVLLREHRKRLFVGLAGAVEGVAELGLPLAERRFVPLAQRGKLVGMRFLHPLRLGLQLGNHAFVLPGGSLGLPQLLLQCSERLGVCLLGLYRGRVPLAGGGRGVLQLLPKCGDLLGMRL